MKSTRSRIGVRSKPALAALGFLAVMALAPAGVPLTATDGVRYGWDLDTPAVNVQSGKVTYYIDPRGSSDNVTGPLTVEDALRQGISNWETGATRIGFLEDTSRKASTRDGTDRVNWIGFVSGGLGPNVFAATFPTRDGARLLDSDVLFNDRDFQWDTRTPGVLGSADVEALMTHEWGHAIGADHVPLRLSSMYAFSRRGSIRERSLAGDDRALVGSMYPNQTYSQTTGDLSGFVDVLDENDDRAVHVVAVSVFTAEPAASTLTGPDGSYTIEGLPAGGYRILAAPTLPLDGSMNAFWEGTSNDFLPGFLGAEDANPTQVSTVIVAAGQTTLVPTFSVADKSDPFENNDDISHAKTILLGDGVAARFESSTDIDVYAFDADAGQVISVSVLAYEIGSQGDPILELLDAGGAVLASNIDIRSPTIFQTQSDGEDLDARLIGVPITQTGRYHVRVSNGAFNGGTNSFYGLLVTAASDAPSAALTTITTDCLRIDADGVSTTTITIRPRRETGDDVGPGETVTLAHDGAGVAPTDTLDVGDGTYTATVTAPTTAGIDRFSFTITTQFGTATLMDALVLVYLGPASNEKTTIRTTPRRIHADGSTQSIVVIVPRDDLGQELGDERNVTLVPSGVAGTLSGVADQHDGSYADVLTSGTTEGAVTITATVDGLQLTNTGTVELGFPLADVLTAAIDDIAFALGSELPKKAQRLLQNAGSALAKARNEEVPGPATPEEKLRVRKTRSGLVKLIKARKKAKGALPDEGTELELVNALRQTAGEALARAVATSAKQQRRLDAAQFRFGNGDAFRDAGNLRKASTHFVSAYLKAVTLAP